MNDLAVAFAVIAGYFFGQGDVHGKMAIRDIREENDPKPEILGWVLFSALGLIFAGVSVWLAL